MKIFVHFNPQNILYLINRSNEFKQQQQEQQLQYSKTEDPFFDEMEIYARQGFMSVFIHEFDHILQGKRPSAEAPYTHPLAGNHINQEFIDYLFSQREIESRTAQLYYFLKRFANPELSLDNHIRYFVSELFQNYFFSHPETIAQLSPEIEPRFVAALTQELSKRFPHIAQRFNSSSTVPSPKPFQEVINRIKNYQVPQEITAKKQTIQKFAMPFHSTSGDRAEKIMQEGFHNPDFFEQFNEHFDTFFSDLSPEAQQELKDFVGEDYWYSTKDWDTPESDSMVEKLIELWMDENPDAHLIWATDTPNADYLSPHDPGILEFDENNRRLEPFLYDGYGTGYLHRRGPIPKEDFRSLSPQEIEEIISAP